MHTRRLPRFALLFFAALFFVVALHPVGSGAEEAITTEAQLVALGARKLTAAEIESTFSGKTAYARIISGDHVGEVRSHTFNRDGSFKSKNLWDGEEDGDKWYVADDQRLCRRYLVWFGRHLICRTVYAYGDAFYWAGTDGAIECMVFKIE